MSLARGQNPRHKTLCRQPANRNQPREIGLSRLYSTIDTGHERRKYRETTSIPSSFFSIHPSIRPSILVPFPHLPPPLLSCLSPPNLPSFSILDSSVQPDPLDPFSAVSELRASRGHLAPFPPFSMINMKPSVDRFSSQSPSWKSVLL